MSTAPYTQGQICAPAARKKLSFLDRFLTLVIFRFAKDDKSMLRTLETGHKAS